jgi:hypothetical protein
LPELVIVEVFRVKMGAIEINRSRSAIGDLAKLERRQLLPHDLLRRQFAVRPW